MTISANGYRTAAANKVLCRLSEKLRSRLLSIITEAQLAVERAHEIVAGLTEEKTKLLIDEIYGSSYKLTCSVLGIQRGRRAETRKQFIQKQCMVLRKFELDMEGPHSHRDVSPTV